MTGDTFRQELEFLKQRLDAAKVNLTEAEHEVINLEEQIRQYEKAEMFL